VQVIGPRYREDLCLDAAAALAALATVAAFLDTMPDAPAAPAQPWAPAPLPSAGALLADNLLRHVERLGGALALLARPRTTVRRRLAAWPATRELLADSPAPETSLNRMVGPGRNLALIRTTLDQVKEVAHAHQATANDVLLAVTAGGLRALLRSRGEPVEDTTVPIYVPVSLRARARTSLGSLFGGRIVRRLLLKAVVRQRVNVTTASIPGPEAPLYLAGARALEVFPVLPLIANEPLGVGALSYAGTFAIGVVADQDACPDLDVFTAAMRDDLHALGVATPIPEG